MNDNLSDRKKKILKTIIDAHITYGEPVGSKYLSLDDDIRCSSATIRNEMAELEELGYLEQPHTSSGRVPSELGYRFYVDSLVRRYRMSTKELDEMNRSLHRKLAEVDEILSEASRLASSLTNYTGIAIKPRAYKVTISRFECVYIDARSFVLVMIFPDGSAKTKTLHIEFPISSGELASLKDELNEKLTGVAAADISYAITSSIEKALPSISAIVMPVAQAIFETLSDTDGGDVKLEGVNNLFNYPEYSDASSIRDLVGMFEHKDDILSLLDNSDEDKVNVYIGKENSLDVMNNSSLIYRTIKRDGHVVGAIGIIGPCRMDYSKVISTVECLAKDIDSMLNEKNPTLSDGKAKGDR